LFILLLSIIIPSAANTVFRKEVYMYDGFVRLAAAALLFR